MDIEVIKKLIRKYQSGHTDFVRQSEKAKAYYRNETDIMFPPLKEEQEKKSRCGMQTTGFHSTSTVCWLTRRHRICLRHLRFLILETRMRTKS